MKTKKNIPSNKKVIQSFEENIQIIEEAIKSGNNTSFEQAARIKSEYCFSLAELENIPNLSKNIIS